MVRCEKCASPIRNPVRDFPRLCRHCGKKEIQSRIDLKAVRLRDMFEFTGDTRPKESPMLWPMLGCSVLAVALVLCWVLTV